MTTSNSKNYEITSTSKGDIYLELRTKYNLSDKEANAYYNENLKGEKGKGLTGIFDEILLKKNPTVEEIEKFIEENNGNKTSLKSFLISRAKLAKDIKESLAKK